MKKWIFAGVLFICILALCGCEVKSGNRIIEGKDVQTFTYAYVRLGDRNIAEGYITQWRDYENSDEVQILIDGKYYLTHYSCVVLVADPSQGALTYSNPSTFGGEN